MNNREEINAIEDVFRNYSVNHIQQTDNNIMLSYHLRYNGRFRKDTRLTDIFIKSNNILRENPDFMEGRGTFFLKRLLYYYSDVERGDDNILLSFMIRNLPEHARVFLVEINGIRTDQLLTYQRIEELIRRRQQNININITEVNIVENIQGEQRINERIRLNLRRGYSIYSFAIIINNEVRFISEFFSMISEKQFYRRNGSFISSQFENFNRRLPNDFLYYMQPFFRELRNGQRIPRFNREFNFPLNFYNILDPIPFINNEPINNE